MVYHYIIIEIQNQDMKAMRKTYQAERKKPNMADTTTKDLGINNRYLGPVLKLIIWMSVVSIPVGRTDGHECGAGCSQGQGEGCHHQGAVWTFWSCAWVKSQSDHLTKGRSVKAPEMTLPMVLEMPTTEMRKAAELAATPAHHIVQVLFIKSEYIKYIVLCICLCSPLLVASSTR